MSEFIVGSALCCLPMRNLMVKLPGTGDLLLHGVCMHMCVRVRVSVRVYARTHAHMSL